MTTYSDPLWNGVATPPSVITPVSIASTVVASSFTVYTGAAGLETKKFDINQTGDATFQKDILYERNYDYFSLKPATVYGFGFKIKSNSSQGGVANRNFQIGVWDNNGAYTGLLTIDDAGSLTLTVGGLVSFGANNSGGSGKRLMLVPNA